MKKRLFLATLLLGTTSLHTDEYQQKLKEIEADKQAIITAVNKSLKSSDDLDLELESGQNTSPPAKARSKADQKQSDSKNNGLIQGQIQLPQKQSTIAPMQPETKSDLPEKETNQDDVTLNAKEKITEAYNSEGELLKTKETDNEKNDQALKPTESNKTDLQKKLQEAIRMVN